MVNLSEELRLAKGASIYVADVQVVDGNGNSTAPVTTTNLTTTGNTTLGDAVSDTATINGATTIKSTSASGLTVGANGATNPVLKIDASTASQATGLSVTGAAAAGGLAVAVVSSGTNESLTIDAKGSGTVTINNTATGGIALGRATTVNGAFTANSASTVAAGEAVSAGGTANCRLTVGNISGFGVYTGSGAPTVSAPQGSLYLRTDGSSTSTRAFIATNSAGAWTAITTAT